MEINDLIIKHASNHVGLREIPGNEGFRDELFEERMKNIAGWEESQAWCAYFVELMWREVYRKIDLNIDKELAELFSASAVKTWDNFSQSPRWVTSKYPVKGSVIIWQKYNNGKADWRGHAGILVKTISNYRVETIEGNTGSQDSREGEVVAYKKRPMNFNEKDGLIMQGFIQPRMIFEKIEPKDFQLWEPN